jgi:hypothetical protein
MQSISNYRRSSTLLNRANVGRITMRDRQDRESSISGRTVAIIIAAFVVVLVILTWAPWNPQHVASNPGPSGTPGSTAVDQTPPPAAGPSGNTTGTAR